VIGALPRELNGRYLRIGPNPLGSVDRDTHHWFVGAGMVHGMRLAEGRAIWYRNRWVRSAELCAELGEDPGQRRLGGSNNTHVIGHAGRTWAIVEAGAPPVELGYELDTVGVNDFFGTLTDKAFTAHPKIDPDTGDLHAIGVQGTLDIPWTLRHGPDFGGYYFPRSRAFPIHLDAPSLRVVTAMPFECPGCASTR
jgi:carotenoid cleavage dioxygenase-like enzyme